MAKKFFLGSVSMVLAVMGGVMCAPGPDASTDTTGQGGTASGRSVEMKPNAIYIDGKPTLLRGGTVQWSRLPRHTWEDRLKRFKAAGYNTVDMYVAWRNHEPEEGKFDFETHDIRAFLELAKKLGLYVYFRPGPYITNEMDGGGVPAWVFTKTTKAVRDADQADGLMNLRTNDRDYIDAIQRYFSKLDEVIKPYLHSQGGPIVLYGIENEYTWFMNAMDVEKLATYQGKDERPKDQVADIAGYLSNFRDIVRSHGIDVPITTCPGDGRVSAMGDVDDLVPMPNFYTQIRNAEKAAGDLLRDMHNPKNHSGKYTQFPTGVTETLRAPSVLSRFVLGGMDAVFQFNAAGMAQEGYQNAVVLNGRATGSFKETMDAVATLFQWKRDYLRTGFFRAPVGYFGGVVDFYGPIGPSGTLRDSFYHLRRINMLFDSLEESIAEVGMPARSAMLERLDGEDRRVVVRTDIAGVPEDGASSRVNYWLPFANGGALLGLYNGGAKPIALNDHAIDAFDENFPRFSSFVVPVEEESSVGETAHVDREYVKFVPIRIPLHAGHMLRYSTSEVLSIRGKEGSKTVYLYGPKGATGETRFTGEGVRLENVPAGVTVHEPGSSTVTVTYKHEGVTTFSVVDATGARTKVVLLETRMAERAWFLQADGQEVAVLGPDYVDAAAGANLADATLEFRASKEKSDVLVVSDAPVRMPALVQDVPFDSVTRLSRFHVEGREAPVLRGTLSKGAKLEDLGEATEGFDDSGWISLGDEPDFLERHGIYVGHAWYRGKVDLTAAEAANPGPLTLGTVSDFAGIYINGKYLLTLSPLGTEVDSGSKDVDYKFQIPAGVLHAGTNTIAIRNEIWGHGSFMFPRGTVKRVALGALGPFVVPGMRASIPALGFDSMKGVAGPARLGQKAITQWKLRAGLGGEGNGFTSGGSFGVGATPAAGGSGAQGADFPMALKAGEVSWYRTVFSTKDLPSPSTWSAPAALVLKGRSAKASVYLNGRLVARWLSDNDWLKRGSWLQPTRNMWVQLTADEYPLPRESMKEGDNTLVIALEDTSDATVGAPPGTVAQAELQFAKEIKVWNGQGIDYADRVHQRVSVQGSNPR